MATPRKPGGYIDRQELNRARRGILDAQRAARFILEHTQGRTGYGWLYPLLAELALSLGTAQAALREMEQIRGKEGDECNRYQ